MTECLHARLILQEGPMNQRMDGKKTYRCQGCSAILVAEVKKPGAGKFATKGATK